MKAALLTEIGGPYEIEEVEIDEPLGSEVLIDVKACGLCHSDLHMAQNDFGFPMPFLQGHETAGVVTAIGPDVRSLEVGDHVVACIVGSCGRCDNCLAGVPVGCRLADLAERTPGQVPRMTWQGRPVSTVGGMVGFAEQALYPEHMLVAVDKAVPFDKVALLGCAVVTGAGAVVRSAGVRFGETVAVFGAGGVGLNSIQAASLSGAKKVIAIDLLDEKLKLARTFGATDLVNPQHGDAVEQVLDLTDGRGVDHAFEVVGLLETLNQAVRMLDHRGTAYVVGMQKPGAELAMNVDLMDINGLMQRERSVRGVKMGSTHPKIDIPLYAEMYLQGRLNLDDLVAKQIGLEDINEGYAELAGGIVARNVVCF